MSSEHVEFAVRGCRLHGRRWRSSASPLLVIGFPGLSGTAERFAFLGDRIVNDRVQLVALDPRGRGQSDVTRPGTYGWENHARDVLAVADGLGFNRFAMIGQSMGASVAMKTAELDGSRLHAVVLIDVAGRVDPGIGPVIASELTRLNSSYESVEAYIHAVRADRLIEPWNDYWDRASRADVVEVDGRFIHRGSVAAVAEDRAYTATQHPYARWKHLTMPTLLLRATRELRPGSGYVVPTDDRVRFAQDLADATVADIAANHLTINTSGGAASAIADFLARVDV